MYFCGTRRIGCGSIAAGVLGPDPVPFMFPRQTSAHFGGQSGVLVLLFGFLVRPDTIRDSQVFVQVFENTKTDLTR